MLFYTLFCMVMTQACDTHHTSPELTFSKKIASYPSGSTTVYLAGSYYIMGDDASEVLMLDKNLIETGRVGMFTKGTGSRTAKTLKADIEASAIVNIKGRHSILYFGSGSLSPQRDSAFLFAPAQKLISRLDMATFYNNLRKDFRDLNIEGATLMSNNLLIGVRGNLTYPDNYLVSADFTNLKFTIKRRILIQSPVSNIGLSGIEFDKYRDILYLTFSSENTSNSFQDGEIGDSYLAVIKKATAALGSEELHIDKLIRLGDIDAKLRRQKIESVSLTDEHNKILLVADDDKGTTRLFMIRL